MPIIQHFVYLKDNNPKSNPSHNIPILSQKPIYHIEISSFIRWNFLKKRNYKMTNISALISDHKLPQRIVLTSFHLLSKNIKAAHPSSTKINNATKIEYFFYLRKLIIVPLRLMHIYIYICVCTHSFTYKQRESARETSTHALYISGNLRP